MSSQIVPTQNPWDLLITVYLCFILDHHTKLIMSLYKMIINNDDNYKNIILTYYFIIIINQYIYCFSILYMKKKYRNNII